MAQTRTEQRVPEHTVEMSATFESVRAQVAHRVYAPASAGAAASERLALAARDVDGGAFAAVIGRLGRRSDAVAWIRDVAFADAAKFEGDDWAAAAEAPAREAREFLRALRSEKALAACPARAGTAPSRCVFFARRVERAYSSTLRRNLLAKFETERLGTRAGAPPRFSPSPRTRTP